MQPNNTEIIDLVDSNDIVIGQIARNDSHSPLLKHGGYIRVADCFIVNSDGKLWVPTRTADKHFAPNGFDFSVGEHLQAGESYEQGMIRGFEEELGFAPNMKMLTLKEIRKPTKDIPVFQAVYLYESNEAPSLNTEDFTKAEWLSPAELASKITNGHPAKQNILPTLNAFFLN